MHEIEVSLPEIDVFPPKFPADFGQNFAGNWFHADFPKDSGSQVIPSWFLRILGSAGNLPANISARNVIKSAAKVWSVFKSLPALVYCEQSAGTSAAKDT